ncbi:MAG: hypothetical protein M3P06_21705 [Acidobacteriota bacterium]|nr:hypothetical protein [Acidobacteriota bacterium]
MTFPPHIDHVLTTYGIRAETKAALYDLYLAMGGEVLEVFADLADGVTSAALLEPDDTLTIREQVVERYLRRNHPRWLEGTPTASLWHPRVAEGRAAGAVVPQGALPAAARRALADDQSLPDGILVLGRNAHFGGRAETISFDVVARDLDDALAIGKADGRQHTIPGSVGATSGTFDGAHRLALLWEVQPNVYKPAGDRNRAIAKIYRRHRNWHVITLVSALEWLTAQNATTFILRGDALAITHEVNPAKPVSEAIAALHDRTVEQVTRVLGFTLAEPSDADELALLDADVMNHALRHWVLKRGSQGVIRRLLYSSQSSE